MPSKSKPAKACKSYKTYNGERVHCDRPAGHDPQYHTGYTKKVGKLIRWSTL